MGVFDFLLRFIFFLPSTLLLSRKDFKYTVFFFLFLWLALRSIDIGRPTAFYFFLFLFFSTPVFSPVTSTEARVFGLHHTFSPFSERENEIAPHPTDITFLCCILFFLLLHLLTALLPFAFFSALPYFFFLHRCFSPPLIPQAVLAYLSAANHTIRNHKKASFLSVSGRDVRAEKSKKQREL